MFTVNSLLIGFLNLWIAKNIVTKFNVSNFLKSVLANLILTTLVIYFTLLVFNKYLVVDSFLSFILFSILQVLISIFLVYILGVEKSHKKIMNQYLSLRLKHRLRKN